MKFFKIPTFTALVLIICSCTSKHSNVSTSKEIAWINISELEAKQAVEKRKVMIDAYTVWCGWCKKMDKHTFEHPEIAKYVNENFYAVKFDAETKTPIEYKGQQYTFVQSGRRGYNELAKTLLKGRMSYPTISFLDEELNIINAFPGYKDAPKFDALLHYIVEEKYVNREPLQDYLNNFNSPVQSIAATVKKSPPIDNSAKKLAAPKRSLTEKPKPSAEKPQIEPAKQKALPPKTKKVINNDFKVIRKNE